MSLAGARATPAASVRLSPSVTYDTELDMKSKFRGYYKPTDEEFDTLWKNAVFVFDTNVLLNLYRYQSYKGDPRVRTRKRRDPATGLRILERE